MCHYNVRLTAITLTIILLAVVSGCAKFTKHESENLTPFAQQTIDLIGTVDYSLNDEQLIYLRRIDDYIDIQDPYARYLALENQVRNMLAALVTYSLQIVAISEQDLSENKKANKLADVILALIELIRKDEVVVNENRDDDRTSETIKQVRQSQDYLEALRLLLPLVNEFSAHAGRVLDELHREKRKMALLVDEAIDKKYGAALKFHEEIRLVKDDVFHTLISLSRYSVTRDPDYIDKMRSHSMFAVLVATENKKSLNTQELQQLHKDITAELQFLNKNYEQLLPDVEAYFEHHRELTELLELKEEAIQEARLAFVVWSRAYQKMASGKTDPAEWFDITDGGKLFYDVARKAAGL